MKKVKLIFATALIVFGLSSCKNSDRESAISSIDSYTNYVDSITNMSTADVLSNWDEIASLEEAKKRNAEDELVKIQDKSNFEGEIENSSKKYNEFKHDVLMQKETVEAAQINQTLRNSLFKDRVVEKDLNFDWVNKDNILAVYDNFVTTTIAHKDSYTKEQWEEIKKMYEALDERKNTVEKEGLTKDDNLKIAKLKIKFAPMYKIEKFKVDITE